MRDKNGDLFVPFFMVCEDCGTELDFRPKMAYTSDEKGEESFGIQVSPCSQCCENTE